MLVAKIDPAQYSGQVPSWAYGTPTWQGAYVFNITLTDGLVLRGNVTHQQGAFVWNSGYDVKRSLYIENVLYTVSDKKIKMPSLDDLALLKEIDFCKTPSFFAEVLTSTPDIAAVIFLE